MTEVNLVNCVEDILCVLEGAFANAERKKVGAMAHSQLWAMLLAGAISYWVIRLEETEWD